VPSPRVALGPSPSPFAAHAVNEGGGEVVTLGEPADALVWLSAHDTDGLREALEMRPEIRWVQLPFAGVERFAETGLLGDGRLWTCAKGAYAPEVAEHGLALALAGLRRLPERARARSWGRPAGTTLRDQEIVIIGAGGIAVELMALLAPFRVKATVVRHHPVPFPGAARTVATDELHSVLAGATVVWLALALTPATTGIIGPPELALMGPRAWLVNVARGGHVQTDALVAALRAGDIGGAALDVTDPEPLPDGHPLWDLPNCLVTPHTADWPEVTEAPLARRISTNVRRFADREPLDGIVDPEKGY